eukprot:2458449-Rhodomonas_salina.1
MFISLFPSRLGCPLEPWARTGAGAATFTLVGTGTVTSKRAPLPALALFMPLSLEKTLKTCCEKRSRCEMSMGVGSGPP